LPETGPDAAKNHGNPLGFFMGEIYGFQGMEIAVSEQVNPGSSRVGFLKFHFFEGNNDEGRA